MEGSSFFGWSLQFAVRSSRLLSGLAGSLAFWFASSQLGASWYGMELPTEMSFSASFGSWGRFGCELVLTVVL